MDKDSQRLAFADLSSSLAQPFTSFDIANIRVLERIRLG